MPTNAINPNSSWKLECVVCFANLPLDRGAIHDTEQFDVQQQNRTASTTKRLPSHHTSLFQGKLPQQRS
jgi:hypothetical protein